MLHITNGASANELLRYADVPGEFLAWDDPLHDGPCPTGLDLAAMSQVRAAFIADCGWADAAAAQERFAARDARLRATAGAEEIVLWSSFELFDQLHTMQLMDWAAREAPATTELCIVGVRGHLGAGQLTPREVRHRYRDRAAVSPAHIETGQLAWRAFCADEPTGLQQRMEFDSEELPFLKCALLRLLEEYPDSDTGLSRTQRQILTALEAGTESVAKLFPASQAMEPCPFMGDSSFWLIVAELANSPAPLLRLADGAAFAAPPPGAPTPAFCELRCRLTALGRAVLARKADWLATHPIERWIGGVHLHGAPTWRWRAAQRAVTIAGADRAEVPPG